MHGHMNVKFVATRIRYSGTYVRYATAIIWQETTSGASWWNKVVLLWIFLEEIKITINIAVDSIYLMSTDGVRVTSKPRALRGGTGVLWSAVFVLQKRTELIDYNTASESDVNQYTSDNCTDNTTKQHAVNETQHSRLFTRSTNFIHENGTVCVSSNGHNYAPIKHIKVTQ